MILDTCPFLSFSNATNIKARDLPEAGGALSNKYWDGLAAYAFACISLIPMVFTAVVCPVA